MKIAMVVPWEESTPPKKYGGIELVAYNIIENLTKMGHDVSVLATGDSEVSGNLIPIFDQSTRQLPQSTDQVAREGYTFLGISRVLEKLEKLDVDIVHNHLGWRFLLFHKMIKQPVISTLHLNLDNPYEQNIYSLVPNHPFISISKSQRVPLPGLNYISNVYNGIRVKRFDYQEKPKDYLVFLGSFVEHKGPHKAIEIAKKTNNKLILAGKIDPLQKRYFDKKIKPYIDDDQIKFIGEVDHAEKNKLLGGAKALLMPILWSEPFGLVMVEAMACGTPVVALNKGSVPEIIKDGVNGYICEDFECMERCVNKIDKINRQDCRTSVEERFTARIMTQNYIKAYNKVLKKKAL